MYLDNLTSEPLNKQRSTSSYISDDCKVLYIETVIEVAKPVFYERTNDTVINSSTEYHHQQQKQQHPQQQQQSDEQRIVPDVEEHQGVSNVYRVNRHIHESSDDEPSQPVKLSTSNHHHYHPSIQKVHQVDSGIEYDQTSPPASSSSSSSTILNQRTIDTSNLIDKRLLIPPLTNGKPVVDPVTLIRRVRPAKPIQHNAEKSQSNISETESESFWNRLKRIWFRSLLFGFLLLFLLFFVYYSRLDSCSRRTLMRSICETIICVESEGLPTI